MVSGDHSVLNDLYRVRLPPGRIIWLQPRLLPPSPISKLGRRHTERLRKRDNLLTGELGEKARRPGLL